VGGLHCPRPLGSHDRARGLAPHLESLPHLVTVVGGREEVTPRSKVLGDGAHTRRGAVALQLIGDEHPGRVRQAFEQLTEAPLGRVLVPLALPLDIEGVPRLIHGAPEIVPLPPNREKDLIQMPLIARPATSTAQLIGVLLAQRATPFPDRLVGHHDAAGNQELFPIPITEANPDVQPDRVTDHLGGEAVVPLAIDRWWVHAASMPHRADPVQAAQQVDRAKK
jgi:hypothetical protein